MSGREFLPVSKLSLALAIAIVGVGCRPTAPVLPPTPQGAALAPRIIPSPASLALAGGAPFELTTATRITVAGTNPEAAAIAEGLAAMLRRATGFPLPVTA